MKVQAEKCIAQSEMAEFEVFLYANVVLVPIPGKQNLGSLNTPLHGVVDLEDRAKELMNVVRCCKEDIAKASPVKIPTPPLKKWTGNNLLDGKNKVNEFQHLAPYMNEEKPTEHGFVPDTRYVLNDIDQEAKEEALLSKLTFVAYLEKLLLSLKISNRFDNCIDMASNNLLRL
ncbi:hypothetical protein IFM89_019861 [Coptis chinensis]|uniref:Uncharacterized protein n=1 Tax=Coptis chinensis TaxID=261450 RepID=A0A835IWM0_9MAGN|nr:hypothetical protein IFM89_019861 [Coptis chinensis]